MIRIRFLKQDSFKLYFLQEQYELAEDASETLNQLATEILEKFFNTNSVID